MSNQQIKRERENELDTAFRRIPRTLPVLEWLSSEEYRKFIEAWKALREVYIEDDAFIEFHIYVVDVYRSITSHLREILADPTLEAMTREAASEALIEVEFWMDELFREAQRNLYLIEDMDGEV